MKWFATSVSAITSTNTRQRCTLFAGGLYQSGLSSTHSDLNPSEPGQTDVLAVGGERLEDFLFNTIHPNGLNDMNYHFVGLQRDSTLLKALYDKKVIGSKSWGYASGSTSGYPLGTYDEPRADGMLTLGGYDKSQFEGEPVKQSLDTSTKNICALSVKIKNMVLKDTRGTVNLMTTSEPFSYVNIHVSTAYQRLHR